MVKPANQPAEAPVADAKPNGAPPAPVATSDSFPVPGTPEWDKMNQRRAELIHKKVYSSLTAEEEAEFEYLQRRTREAVNTAYPLPPVDLVGLRQLEAELRDARGNSTP